jgi:hypothetical protein
MVARCYRTTLAALAWPDALAQLLCRESFVAAIVRQPRRQQALSGQSSRDCPRTREWRRYACAAEVEVSPLAQLLCRESSQRAKYCLTEISTHLASAKCCCR